MDEDLQQGQSRVPILPVPPQPIPDTLVVPAALLWLKTLMCPGLATMGWHFPDFPGPSLTGLRKSQKIKKHTKEGVSREVCFSFEDTQQLFCFCGLTIKVYTIVRLVGLFVVWIVVIDLPGREHIYDIFQNGDGGNGAYHNKENKAAFISDFWP